MVIMCTISTSLTLGPRRIRASTSVSGSAHPGWIYTRIPDSTHRKASSDVCNFLVYSFSQDISCDPLMPFLAVRGFPYCRVRDPPFVTDGRIVHGAIKKLFQQLQHFQFAEHFNGAFQDRLFLDELPQ